MGVKFRNFAFTGGAGGGATPISALGVFFSATQNVLLTPQTIVPSGGTAPYSFGAGGTLPAGVVINAGTGQITGTPTVSGNVLATITITDALGATGTAIAAFGIGQTRFTDTFDRVSLGTNNIGRDWFGGEQIDVITAAIYANPTVGALGGGGSCVQVQGLIWGQLNQAGGAVSPRTKEIPLPLMWSAVNGVSQYSQMKLCRRAAGSVDKVILAGPGVLVTSDHFYTAELTVLGLFRLIKVDSGTQTILVTSGSTPVNGDVIKIEVIRNGVIDNTVNVYINGVLDMTSTDGAAPVFAEGYPGLVARASGSVGTASVSEWALYDGGIL